MKKELVLQEKEKLAQTKSRLEKRQKLINEMERKIQWRKSFELGDLVIKAGLDYLDRDVLLGALLEIRERTDNPEVLKEWNQKTELWLRSNTAKRLIIKLPSEAPLDMKEALRTRKFKWNAFRQEWYGFGKKEELLDVLGTSDVEVIEVAE
jgi:hypothetical protein